MFGGAKPTFGATSTPSGFGFSNTSTVTPFGQSAFAKPATTGFGQSSSFGQPNSSLFNNNTSTGLFGAASTPAFGATNTQTNQTGFGGFSQPQSNSLFGNNAANPGNQSSLFGPTSTGSTSAFAKPAGFGYGQPTSIFGTSSTTNTTGNGNFFMNTSNPGTGGGGGIFGSGPTSAFAPTNSTGQNGTAIAKYTPTLGSDTLVKSGQTTNVNTKQLCITFMKEYENKSVEELRFEDYMANRKGAQPGSSTGGMFGSTVQSNSLFPSATPQPAGSMFGQPQTSQPTSTLFGTQNNTISGFGQTQSAFGTPGQQQPASQPGLFGKPFTNSQPTNTFGGFNQQPQAQPSAFGAINKPFGQTTGIFGQPQTNTGFGQAAPAPFSGFGTTNQQTQQQQQQPTSVFGSGLQPQANAFGLSQTSNAGFTGFGNTNTNTAGSSIFNKPGNAFATSFPAATSTAPNFGAGFGQTNTGSSIFNNTMNKPAVSGFPGFGTQPNTNTLGGLGSSFGNTSSIFNNNTKPGGIFSNPVGGSTFGNTTNSPFGSTMGGALGNQLMGGGGMTLGTQNNNQQNAVPIHQQLWQMGSATPYGENPIFKDLKPLASSNEKSLKATNPAAQKALLEQNNTQFKVSPKIGNGVKVKPVNSILTKKSLFEGLEEYDSTLEDSFSLKPNAKRLVIKPRSTPKSQNNTSNANNSMSRNLNDSSIGIGNENDNTLSNTPKSGSREIFQNNLPLNPLPIENNNDNGRRVSWLQTNTLDKVRQNNVMSESILDNSIKDFGIIKDNDNIMGLSTVQETNAPTVSKFNAQTSSETFLTNRSFADDISHESLLGQDAEPHPTGITLRRSGYYMMPSLEEVLALMDENGRCVVPNFTIGRRGYGNVYFNESFDVAGLNLDEIVHFRHKEVVIYPDDENKPEIGSGLNRKAQITLDQVWPHDKSLHEPIKEPERLALMDFESKLRRVCDKHDTKFLEYRPDTGSWVFKVDHFSKYGLSDSEDEDDAATAKLPTDPKKAKLGAKLEVHKIQDKELKQNGLSNKILTQSKYAKNIDLTNNNSMLDNEYTVDLMVYPPTSPSAALALGLKTDSHKLQLMKASFFLDDDYDGKSVVSDITEGRDSPDQTVPNRPLFNRKNQVVFSSESTLGDLAMSSNNSVHSDGGMSNDITIVVTPISKPKERPNNINKIVRSVGPRAAMPLIVHPKIKLINIKDTSIPLESSILSRFLGFRGNLAFFNGKKFKIGWDNQNTLLIMNTAERCNILEKAKRTVPLAAILNGRETDDFSSSVIQKIKISSISKIKNFKESIEDHLLIQLNTDKRVRVDDTDCPYFQENGGTTALNEHLELAQKLSKVGDYNLSVWSLLNSLWGYCEELDDERATNHKTIMFRREQFSEWIENVITDTNLIQKSIERNDYLDHLWALLLCFKITDACELAFNNNDINLAMLISQISGGPRVRQLVEKQIISWHDINADNFISSKRLKILMLISGMSLMSSGHGPINIFEDMDWLKALAISLWYLCSPTSSITDSLLLYEKSFMSDDFYANSPDPPYQATYNSNSSNQVYDIRYHLLKLYSQRSHPMESLLNPSTHTADSMDFRLSWLIMQQLETLGYHHLSELARSQVHVSFASQLENHGLWHWSIYVLLHLRDQSRRELAVQELLYRYIEVSEYDEFYLKQESFLINDLEIPLKWIYWAKAVKCGVSNRYDEQANYLLKAKQWSLAHEIVMTHIAPDTIINDNIEHLKILLEQFEDTTQISNWANQGKILRDFIKLNEEFEEIKYLSENEVELRLNDIQEKISYLCSVIKLFPCPTSKHRLCQSDIAQRLAYLIRTINDGNPSINFCGLMSAALKKLPLPPDYTLRELDHVLTARKFQK